MPSSKPILSPGDTIGILGGGQLARMLALAAAPLGLKTHIFAPDDHSPAFDVATRHTIGDFDDQAALEALAKSVPVVTFETENIPTAPLDALAGHTSFFPPPRALSLTQDRLHEKSFIRDLGIAVPPFSAVDHADDLAKAISAIGLPSILKTRRFGYDGKGQIKLAGATRDAFAALGGVPCILEAFIPFEREISVIATRGRNGEFAAFDPPENVHRNHILSTSTVPARISPRIAEEAIAATRRIAEALDYVGTLAVEFFLTGDGSLLVNEIAPRVHNSGHWTIEACTVSQFEAHIRAIAGWPLGNLARRMDAVMTNLVGDDVDGWAALLADPDSHLHLYGKREARPGRKMGHVTRLMPRAAPAKS